MDLDSLVNLSGGSNASSMLKKTGGTSTFSNELGTIDNKLRYVWLTGYFAQLTLTLACNYLLIYLILFHKAQTSHLRGPKKSPRQRLTHLGRLLSTRCGNICAQDIRTFVTWFVSLKRFLWVCRPGQNINQNHYYGDRPMFSVDFNRIALLNNKDGSDHNNYYKIKQIANRNPRRASDFYNYAGNDSIKNNLQPKNQLWELSHLGSNTSPYKRRKLDNGIWRKKKSSIFKRALMASNSSHFAMETLKHIRSTGSLSIESSNEQIYHGKDSANNGGEKSKFTATKQPTNYDNPEDSVLDNHSVLAKTPTVPELVPRKTSLKKTLSITAGNNGKSIQKTVSIESPPSRSECNSSSNDRIPSHSNKIANKSATKQAQKVRKVSNMDRSIVSSSTYSDCSTCYAGHTESGIAQNSSSLGHPQQHIGGRIKKSRVNLLIAWLSFCDALIILSLPIYLKYEFFMSSNSTVKSLDDGDDVDHLNARISNTSFHIGGQARSFNKTTTIVDSNNDSLNMLRTVASATIFPLLANATIALRDLNESYTKKTAVGPVVPPCQDLLFFYFFNDFSGFNNSLSTTYLAFDRFRAIYNSIRFKNGVPLPSPHLWARSGSSDQGEKYDFFYKENRWAYFRHSCSRWWFETVVPCFQRIHQSLRVVWPIFMVCFSGGLAAIPITLILHITRCSLNRTQEKYYLIYSTAVGIVLPVITTTGLYLGMIILLSKYHFGHAKNYSRLRKSRKQQNSDASQTNDGPTTSLQLKRQSFNKFGQGPVKKIDSCTSTSRGSCGALPTRNTSFETSTADVTMTTEMGDDTCNSPDDQSPTISTLGTGKRGSRVAAFFGHYRKRSSSLLSLIQRLNLGHRRVQRSRRNEVKAIRMAMTLIITRTMLVAPLITFQVLEIAGYISLNPVPVVPTPAPNIVGSQKNITTDSFLEDESVTSKNAMVYVTPFALKIIVNAMNIFGLTDRWANVIIIMAFCTNFRRQLRSLFNRIPYKARPK